ncbi:hypothetical protein K435DRAFT_388293 [Dendrothele bispora CBS 962.96]|uniref:Zn(2)-C6 fungal-type domain-containing protein n=1 Tax=Dendrothele bispora (strain CBS 962.96) TaxID=1314807 RepID=A0A4S8MBP0_DENBC|nr:hypothetical protein K435DRAFT_500938 [Dendrothele bispora CBS 962.96]THV01717.1 hypothetical protein K435DRAFT_388293 [Dendrothele bispora CBS 962.96]
MSLSGTHAPDRDNPPNSASYPNMQSVTDSGMPMHMFPLSTVSTTSRSKRKQVKNACTNCQKACKKCDECRPCLRCVKYGHPDQCVDSQRKERKKGVKRGKYKKRDGKGNNVEPVDGPFLGMPLLQSPSTEHLSTGETYTESVGFEPSSYHYGHYPPAIPKSNVQMYCADYYPMQEATSSAHSGDNHEYTSQHIQDHQRLYGPVASYPPTTIQYPPSQLPCLPHHAPQPTYYSTPPYTKSSTAGIQERMTDYDDSVYR